MQKKTGDDGGVEINHYDLNYVYDSFDNVNNGDILDYGNDIIPGSLNNLNLNRNIIIR